MLPRSGWVGIFFVVVLVIVLGQFVFFAYQQEIDHLREENAQLKEHDKQYEAVKEELNKYKEGEGGNNANGNGNANNKEFEELQAQVEELQQKLKLAENTHTNTNTDTNANSNTNNNNPSIDSLTIETVASELNVVTNRENLIYLVKNFNTYGAIRNADKFQLEEDYIPLVIRVYNKHEYLKFSLEQMRNVDGINKTMIIVSHDGIFEEVFKVVQEIDFCQVKQIIHPHSAHLFKNRFPGPDKTIPDIKDHYDHSRPTLVSMKHHYWWHLNFVWDQFLPNHQGNILILEEDHIPTYDFYITAKALAKIRDEKCPNCYNAKLGQERPMRGTAANKLHISYDLGNHGLIVKRTAWEKLRKAGKEFCTFDDYNYDWTMLFLSTKDLIPNLSLTTSFPRVEHLARCGTHFKGGKCGIDEQDYKFFEDLNKKLREQNSADWSKYDLSLTPVDSHPNHLNGWGGWAHPMDHQLCIDQIKKE